MRIPLIAGHWKMYKTIAEAVELAEALLRRLGDIHDREVLICPPYTALHALSPLLQETPIALGAQDVFYEEQGAYTGAISPLQIKDVGFWGPDFILFLGENADGKPVRLIQHYAQINVLLDARKKPEEREARRIGFQLSEMVEKTNPK